MRLGHHPKVRIGVLFSGSGLTSPVEKTQYAAVTAAVAEVNARGGVKGFPVEILFRDPGGDPRAYGVLAEELIAKGVRHFIGCYMSSARLNVVPVMERTNSLLCYPTFYEGFEYSANVLYFGSLPNQTHPMFLDYIMEKYGSRIWLIGSDYIFPRESNRLFNDMICRKGGVVVGESYLSLGAAESSFDVTLKRVKLAQPSAIVSTVVGNDTIKLYSAYGRAGLISSSTPIASVTMTEAELATLPAGSAIGHLSCGTYFAGSGRPENRIFEVSYGRYQNGQPNMCAEAAYTATHVLCEALNLAESDDPRSVVMAASRLRFSAPQGDIFVDPKNNHCNLWCSIARVNDNNLFDVVYESPATSAPDPYMISLDQASSRVRMVIG